MPNQPSSRRVYSALVVDPRNSSRLYWGACAEEGGVYKSEDGGNSWQRVFKDSKCVFNLAINKKAEIFAGCSDGNLYKSRDCGETWNKLTNNTYGSIIGICFDSQNENTIYISHITWSGDAGLGVMKSEDGGLSWQSLNQGLMHKYIAALAYSALTNDLFAGSRGGSVFKLENK